LKLRKHKLSYQKQIAREFLKVFFNLLVKAFITEEEIYDEDGYSVGKEII